MENHPKYLTEMAYEWCSVIFEHYQPFRHKKLLFFSLEAGFRHLNSKQLPSFTNAKFHHCKLIDITFESGDGEAIADLLLALSSIDRPCQLCGSPDMWIKYLKHLQYLQPFSSRLRKHLIHFINSVAYKGPNGIGIHTFVVLLEDLHVGIGDVVEEDVIPWIEFLLDTIQSPEASQLSYHYWELLVKLSIAESGWLQIPDQYILSAQVMVSLEDAKEWDKLECWIGVVWISWPPEKDETTEDSRTTKDGRVTGKGLEDVMLSLFHHQPGAIQRLQRLMGKCEDKGRGFIVPNLFKRICEQLHLKAEQQGIQ